ncbi:MAG: PucR family transcriptional regulator [Ruminococcus sp.]|jgi:DNA-binding PucR family transcriptional regulator
MGVTLQQLCENSSKLYHMVLIAGRGGMQNCVQWVHTLEDEEASEFINGGELIFTTGIGHRDLSWLLNFAKSLKSHSASGLVLNMGPYLTEVPKKLTDYCDREDFPLFTVPWETRLVDITRNFCNQIIRSEKKEENVGTTLKNLIFFPQDLSRCLPLLERYDFDSAASCCVIYMGYMEDMEYFEEVSVKIPFEVEKIFSHLSGWTGHFHSDRGHVYVVSGMTNDQIRELMTRLERYNRTRTIQEKLTFGISSNRSGAEKLPFHYRRAVKLFEYARKQRKTAVFFEDLNTEKILFSVDNYEILEEYLNDTLGELIMYDKSHHTNYLGTLRLYLECGGSVKQAADQMFVHRNTVNYQLNKIKQILNLDYSVLEDQFRLDLAIKILDIL